MNNAMTPVEDISAATENILIQAEAMGLGTCWSGFVFEIFRGLDLGIKGALIVSLIASLLHI